MKSILILIMTLSIAIFFLESESFAELYKWTDKDGTINVTNDLDKVPYEYRDQVDVREDSPYVAPSRSSGPMPVTDKKYRPWYKPDKSSSTIQEVGRLYGGKNLKWWSKKFQDIRAKINELEVEYDSKDSYVKVFEGGRYVGQIYTQEEILMYEDYRLSLEKIEKEIEDKKLELGDLTRSATRHGVPRKIREGG
ncbi:MAG: hypothetical protein KAR06_08995 [Deltaproteobacteria bacterium]|nr:hypothetical protein [Deltaproteobacteria bacterium]